MKAISNSLALFLGVFFLAMLRLGVRRDEGNDD